MSELRSGRKSVRAMEDLLDRLASGDPEIRSAANRELETIPVQDVIRTLETSFIYLPRTYKWTAVLAGLGAASAVFLASYWIWHILAACFFAAMGFVVGIALTSTAIMPALRQRLLVTIAERLTEVTDVGDLGMILDFVDGAYIPSRKASVCPFSQYPVTVKNSLRDALSRLLPQVNQKIYKALTRTQQEALCILLEEPYLDTGLTLIIIKTLGEYDSLKNWYLRSRLEAFSSQAAVTAHMKEVKTAARMALERVQERRVKEKEAQTLLRGSSTPTPVQAEALLRPAASCEQTSKAQLLRAANTTGE